MAIAANAARAPLLGEHTADVLGALQLEPADTDAAQPQPRPLLDGIRVLDLTQVWAGPYATRFLADMGADVIHIEGPQFPDAVRAASRDATSRGYNKSAYFNEYNRNKRGMALDLRQPQGLDAFKRMVSHADVVVENWSAGVAEDLGIGYDALRAINPRIIMVQMPAFSLDEPESTRVGFGPSIEQMGGLVALQGYEGGPPHKSGISYGDPVGGTVAAGAIALALLRRERSGAGLRVVLSQRDNVIGLIGEFIVAESVGCPLPVRQSNRDADFVPHNVYRAADDTGRAQLSVAGVPVIEYADTWVAIAVDSESAWEALCKVIDDERLSAGRVENSRRAARLRG